MFYVYMYVYEDGTPWYIGKGCKYRKRHYNHHIPKEHKRPADEFIVTVREGMSEAAAFALETELIAKYRRQCDGGTLVNKCLGGPGAKGFKHKPGRTSSFKGRKHKEDSRAKMAQARKGTSNRAICTYVITDQHGNHTVVKNLAKYCRENNLNRKAFTNVLCGRAKSHKGLTIQKVITQ